MSEEGKVLIALGLPRRAVPAVLADPECREIIDGFMAVLRDACRDLNAALARGESVPTEYPDAG